MMVGTPMKQSARLFLALVLLVCFSPTATAQVTAEFYAKDGVDTLFRYHQTFGSITGITVIKYFRVTSGSGSIELVATLDVTGNSTTTKMWVEEGISYQAELKIDFSGSPRLRDTVSGDKCLTVKFDGEAFSTAGSGTFNAKYEPSTFRYWCPRAPVIATQEVDEFQVNASDGTFADHVRVTWNEIAGAVSYRVFRCTSSVESSCGTPIAAPKTNGLDDMGGLDEATYWYRVKACSAGECGDFSNADAGYRSDGLDDHGNSCAEATLVGVNSTTPGTIEKPDSPIRDTPGDFDYFKLFLHAAGTLTVSTTGTTDTFGNLKNAACNTINSDNDSGDGGNFQISRELEAGTYYVSVRGYWWDIGPYQFVSSFEGPPVPPPAMPTGVHATDGKYSDRVSVTFNPVDGATVYRVFRCLTADLSTCGSPIGAPKTGTFDDRGAVPGTVYYYRVHACNATACGALSVANAGFVRAVPTPPTGINASDGIYEDQTQVSWNAVDGMNGYRVFRCTGTDTNSCGSAIGFTEDTRFADPGGVAGMKYWYCVKACVAGICSTFSAVDEGYRAQPQDRIHMPINRFVSFDGDSKDDVLLRHRVTGHWYINFMNWRLVRPNSGWTPLFANLDWEMMGSGDFNGDGRGDVLLRNKLGGGWWINLMYGRMRTGGATPITRNPDWVFAGIDDFDGDGMDDVLLRHRLTGQWQINFMDSRDVRADSGLTPITTDPDWVMMGTGDFNGDGRGDVLLRNKVRGGWWIDLMNGRVNTGDATSITRNLDWVVVGIDDFDGDGKDDVLLRDSPGLWIMNFMDSWTVRPDSGPTSMVRNHAWEMTGTGDFNGDGRGDVLLRDQYSGAWWIYLMNGRTFNSAPTSITMDLDWRVSRFTGESQPPAQFISHTITSSADHAKSVHAEDVDGDGDMDVLSASPADNKVAWYENDGNENFTTHAITTSASGPNSVYAADVDGDGDVDVLSSCHFGNEIAWYENDGNENFNTHTVTNSTLGPRTVYAEDMDGDGDMDVLSASSQDDKIAWHENDGNENFSTHIITTNADHAWAVRAADVDGDGDMDVLSASSDDDKIAWYENDGNENFTPHTITTSADFANSVHAADVDGDGDTDVLSASGGDNKITWYENDGNENFTPRTITTSASSATSVYAADVDGDGDMDVLATAGAHGTVAWYANDGNENFSTHTITTNANNAWSIHAADVDGDGDMDVLSASEYDDKITWYENRIPPVSAEFDIKPVTR